MSQKQAKRVRQAMRGSRAENNIPYHDTNYVAGRGKTVTFDVLGKIHIADVTGSMKLNPSCDRAVMQGLKRGLKRAG
jgi:hypothetical protein